MDQFVRIFSGNWSLLESEKDTIPMPVSKDASKVLEVPNIKAGQPSQDDQFHSAWRSSSLLLFYIRFGAHDGDSQLKMPGSEWLSMQVEWTVFRLHMYLPGTVFEYGSVVARIPTISTTRFRVLAMMQLLGPMDLQGFWRNQDPKQWGVEQWIVAWECMRSIMLVFVVRQWKKTGYKCSWLDYAKWESNCRKVVV